MASYKRIGLTPRTHGNADRQPKHALSYESIKDMVKFLTNYVVQHGLLLPGRVPGYSQSDIKLLPSSTSKRGIWKQYRAAMLVVDSRALAYSTFCSYWKQLLPSVVLMSPMSNLCGHCQQNSRAIMSASNFPKETSQLLSKLTRSTSLSFNSSGRTTELPVAIARSLSENTSPATFSLLKPSAQLRTYKGTLLLRLCTTGECMCVSV